MIFAFTVINFGLLVLIWTVQLVVYPSFFAVEEKSFVTWHKRYTRRISFVVMPLMIIQVCLAAYLLVKIGPRPILVIQTILLSLVWTLTFLISVPCHRALDKKKNVSEIKKLISSNWYRTACWTAIAALDWFRFASGLQ